ncbi:MAG: hypothetical protein IPK22_12455 [Verrucomicrobiaceae bacterium]|nr:hypothetical protein [Verrucomicrobiaceae bacterium]
MKTCLILLLIASAALSARAQTFYLPPGTTFVRAVVSVETTALTDSTWQAFAQRTSSLLATSGHSPVGSLASLATTTGRPEVAVAPVVPYGLSANGRRAMQTAVANPGRCVAVIPHHPGRMFMTGNDGFNFNRLDNSVAADTLFEFTPAFPVPAIFLAGERDNLSGFIMPTENCLVGRRGGNAPWCTITEPNTTHTGMAMPAALVTTILEGMMQRRLPATNWPANQSPTLLPIDVTTGWFGNPATKQIAAYSSYTGDRSKAVWLPDEASANAWAAYVVAQPFEIPPQSVVLPSSVSNLQVFDPANNAIHPSDQSGGTSGEAAWKVCGNLQTADFCYVAAHGSAIYSVPSEVQAAEWIRPMEGAASFTGTTLLSFTLTRDADVFIAHHSAITTKPAWLSSWADTGLDLTLNTGNTLFSAPSVMRLFKKSYTSGQTVELGSNGGGAQSRMYLTIIKPASAGGDEVSLVVSDANAAEAGLGPGSFTVTRGTQTVGAVTIAYTVTGTATSSADYVALSGSVMIPDGQSSAAVTVTPLDDALMEGAETVVLTLQSGAGYTLGATTSGAITLADDEGVVKPQVGISFSATDVVEGAAAELHVTLTRTGATDAALPVSLSVTGDAGSGDYAEFSLNRTIPIGSTSLSFAITLLDDAVIEPAETLTLTVIPTLAYDAATNAAATLTITDDDTPAPAGQEDLRFPAGTVIDITALYPTVIPDDGLDDTAGLQQALNDHADQNRILWLRNGIYHLSDTLEVAGSQRFNTIQGQSRDGVILRLLPNSAGFESGAATPKPMINIAPGGSADRFQNELYNVTLDTGTGNPSALGLRWISNNQGGIRRVRLISPQNAEGVGLQLNNGLNGPLLIKEVIVEGFRIGIQTGNAVNSAILEHCTVRNQGFCGLYNVQQIVTARRLVSEQSLAIPALINGDSLNAAGHWFGLVTLVDCEFTCTAAGAMHALTGVGNLSAHRITISGYTNAALARYASYTGLPAADVPLSGPGITRWLKSHATANAALLEARQFPANPMTMAGLEVLETPEVPWDDPTTWVNAADFATGDGVTDDTAALQAAVDSMKPGGANFGKTTLVLPGGKTFLIQGTIEISGPVRRIIGTKGRVLGGNGIGRLRIVDSGANDAPLLRIERLSGFASQFVLEHASKRSVAVANTTGVRFEGRGRGDFFIEDCVGGQHSFTSSGQRIWARSFNAEGAGTKIVNDSATLWILGLKTEKYGTVLATRNGGWSEVWGGLIYRVDLTTDDAAPMFEITDAHATLTGIGEYDATVNQTRNYANLVTEARGGTTLTADRAFFTGGTRHNGSRILYLYAGAASVALTPWQHWQMHTPGASGLESGDLDHDGKSDLLEYALGTDPAVSDAGRQPLLTSTHFEVRLPAQGRSDLHYIIEQSATLLPGSWTEATPSTAYLDPWTHEEVFQAPVAPDQPSIFFRLRVVRVL